jgi:ribonuclease VapC
VTDGARKTAVLDASALLALLLEERGAHRVEAALRVGGFMTAINWAEMLSDLAERGESIDRSVPRVKQIVAELGSMTIVPFDERQAAETARLRVPTRHLGLSLADRSCLALGRLHRLPVLTTDRAWRSLHISVRIEVIR